MIEVGAFFSHLWQSYSNFILACIKSLVILSFGLYLSFFLRKKIRQELSKRDEILGNFLAQVGFVCLLILTAITTLGTLGIQTNSLVAILGTTGLAIALGLKDSLSNLASGLMLVILRPFKKDDYIQIGTTKGKVKVINLFHTILTIDNQTQSIIPNTNITKASIINHAQHSFIKLSWTFTFRSKQPIQDLHPLIQKVLDSTQGIAQEPKPIFRLISIQNQILTYALEFWVPSSYSHNAIIQELLQKLESHFSIIEFSLKD
ncbi:mechanosensitive ion channel family protein [Helicobacter kayseriensis]|uniref:mechanosensitive ion channel family protein n=1 Tax=Helicobacter kayseriensis TaxID=2905877 RepID=UPI001E3D2798|nr:mechanosensitive ion channel domain-containing protein [Helicobacter kayseriensis]MCE3046875.1 mechanosensitive ion channel family protein [Helicobacter kayseriensis]MCE3048465.1 mechanosensitive ion channel family protein [Helicobacter kayseriensis]